jgi:hypothetical protein
MIFREFIENTFQFLEEAVLYIINFIFCWGMSVQRVLSMMYDILSLTNATLLTADMMFLCKENLYPAHDSHSPFHTKMYILLLVQCHRTPTKSNLYFDSSFYTVTSEPALYKLLTFHVPSLMSISIA